MEKATGSGPASAGFTVMGGARSTRTFYIGNDGNGDASHVPVTRIDEVWRAVVEILGETRYHTDGLRLARTPPIGDPFWQWTYAESIGSIVGKGRYSSAATDPLGIAEAPLLDYVQIYPCYEFSGVTFSPRPYAVLSDENIPTGSLTYADFEGVEFAGTTYAKEWLRYVDVDELPSGEYITAQAGQFIFDTSASGAIAPLTIDGREAGSGQLRLLIKKRLLKVLWYQVPYRYVTFRNSINGANNIDEGLGCVNQFDITIEGVEYAAGTLLFEGLGVERYVPLVPRPIAVGQGSVGYSTEKLCNISFYFSFKDPPLGYDYNNAEGTPGTPAAYPASPGPIQIKQRGHNRVPYAHAMGFFYAKTKVSGYSRASDRPLYPSYPFELLFTNPGIT